MPGNAATTPGFSVFIEYAAGDLEDTMRQGVGMHQPHGHPLDRNVVKPTIRKTTTSANLRGRLAIATPVLLLSAISHFLKSRSRPVLCNSSLVQLTNIFY